MRRHKAPTAWTMAFVLGLSLAASAQTVTIEGTVWYSGTASGSLMVAAVTNAVDPNIVEEWEWTQDVAGPFTNDYALTNLPTNTYYVIAVMETNEITSEMNPWGHYQYWSNEPVAIATDPGDWVTNIDFELIDGTVSNNPYVGGDGDGNGSARVCGYDIWTCMAPSQGWVFDNDRRVEDEYFFDTWIIQLDNGQYRLYGNSSDQILYGTNAFDSYLSSNGVHFTKEPGYRFQEDGCFMPCVIRLSNGNYRCYYVDQSEILNPGLDNGGRAIRSALSTNGGLDFVGEGDCLVCNTNLAFEYRGIRGARVLSLGYGTYRMYYHGIDSNNVRRVLSASSADGMNWTRDAGVRLDPADYCPPCTTVRNFAPIIPFADGDIHLYVTMSRCGEGWADSHGGIFDSWSADGLNFTVADQPIVESYYIEGTYTGNPTNPQAMPQDPTAIMTTNGMRVYFGVYNGPDVLPGTSGIYSVSLPDWDGDGATDEHEYYAGTDPADPASVLAIQNIRVAGMVIEWPSVSGRVYGVLYVTNLPTEGFQVLGTASNLLATPDMNYYTNTTLTNVPVLFYRVKVRRE